MASKYEALNSPLKIGNVTVKNRYAVSAIAANGVHRGPWAELTEKCIDYRVERARGGFGLFVTNSNYPDLEVDKPGIPGTSPFAVPGAFKQTSMRMLQRMHVYGTKVFMQIAFGPGRIRNSKAPSKMPCYWDPSKETTVITTEEIKYKVGEMIRCAKWAKDLGYDGVEVHALHWGYALDQFSIAWMNDRTDEYGAQSWDNRLAIPRQLVQGIKEVCGEDYPVSIALGLEHFMKGYQQAALNGEGEVGRSLEDAKIIAKKLEEYGYDMLDCDAGCYESYFYSNPPYYIPKCWELYLAKEVKKEVSIPVYMTGKMTDPDICEEAVKNGEVDGISLGRAMMADPYYPNKVLTGHPERVRPCIACTNCLDTMNKEGLPKCSVNPNCFIEHDYSLGVAGKAKNVIVVGGGIAGMAAACYLDEKGHNVVLYEASDRLGGNLFDEFELPFKKDVKDLYDWYLREIDRLGIEVHLNSPMDVSAITAANPDAVILATGSTYAEPAIEGAESSKVVKLQDAIYGKAEIGDNVVIYGSDLAGSELAYYLAEEKGRKVTLVEKNASVLTPKPFVGKPARDMLIELLKANDVTTITGSEAFKVTDAGLEIKDAEGNTTVISADTVIFSLGMESRPSMASDLIMNGIEAFSIGDELEPGNIRSCTFAAFEVARML